MNKTTIGDNAGFMSRKELAAKYNISTKVLRDRCKRYDILLGCVHQLSPRQIQQITNVLGHWDEVNQTEPE